MTATIQIEWIEQTPVVTIRAHGAFDVGRMIGHLARGRVEWRNLAENAANQLRKSPRGIAVLDLLEKHGGPKLGRRQFVGDVACLSCGYPAAPPEPEDVPGFEDPAWHCEECGRDLDEQFDGIDLEIVE